MRLETGFSGTRSLIDASPKWWEEKIKENKEYAKFRNMDLSIFNKKYALLFRDSVAIGDQTMNPLQFQNNTTLNEENIEGKGDSDEINLDDDEPLFLVSMKVVQDCIGVIDGTHVRASVPQKEEAKYIGRKGYATQNIMVVCDFNMCFTFICADWEGIAHDTKNFNEALQRPDLHFPYPTGDKYYIVDAKYPNTRRYLAPYKYANIHYHLPDFQRGYTTTIREPRGPMRFTFVWTSWEGVAHDTRFFNEALQRLDLHFLYPTGDIQIPDGILLHTKAQIFVITYYIFDVDTQLLFVNLGDRNRNLTISTHHCEISLNELLECGKLEAFAKHELENKTKVESWRKTLVDASNIAGWESKDIANRHESKFIKEIVNTILPILHPVTSSVNDNLIGIETRMQRLKSELKIGSGGVSMIGIWGVGGGGKTTLASSIYSEISSNFDGCCFVENIREKSTLMDLQRSEELGHHIVRGEDPNYPELHSRVWKREDVLTICAMDATTEVDMIEAIRYDSGTIYGLSHLPPVVANTKNLRWIDWQGDLASPLLTKFPQRKLCCLILHDSLQKQLWEGYKNLPTLKIIELYGLDNLLITPDFRGLPNLERFKLIASSHLEEIHPSIGHLERLVFLSIETCSRLKRFPPITRLKKLKTLSFSECPGLFKLSEIQQEKMDNLPHLHLDSSGVTEVQKPGKGINVKYWLEGSSLPRNNMNHIRLCFFRRDLRTLNLSLCNLGDEDIGSSVWELPNLQELDLSANRFSRLCFSLLRLPRLKFLNVTNCLSLAELSELPSSIAILMADECWSLERFGDISKCKWLWKLSLHAGYKVGPLGGDLLLHSMLQGNAIEDHCISFTLQHQSSKSFVGRPFRGNTFTLPLPHDWYNEYSGFLIRVLTNDKLPNINIIIKQEAAEDPPFELWQGSSEAVDPEYDDGITFVGYVSFSSLSHTTSLNSTYNMISFSMEDVKWSFFEFESYVGVELVPRKSKYKPVQTTKDTKDCSEFWDEYDGYRRTFKIQQHSKSSIEILWQP
ncbi:unnamed protein product [Lactuca saligna]|uniref:DDE Tnp4 domain-containing protein n=1 Tax=Lactuca saligna TaxID=75948 RepID=A0AA35ZRI1_LACSI|nr:unnamed protein product [Lactuca saligna]